MGQQIPPLFPSLLHGGMASPPNVLQGIPHIGPYVPHGTTRTSLLSLISIQSYGLTLFYIMVS